MAHCPNIGVCFVRAHSHAAATRAAEKGVCMTGVRARMHPSVRQRVSARSPCTLVDHSVISLPQTRRMFSGELLAQSHAQCTTRESLLDVHAVDISTIHVACVSGQTASTSVTHVQCMGWQCATLTCVNRSRTCCKTYVPYSDSFRTCCTIHVA